MIRLLKRRAGYLKRKYRYAHPRVLADDDLPMSMDMSAESSTLLVAFGGMRGRIGMPPFEFLSLTGGLPVKRLFVRDLRQAWYHSGLPQHGPRLTDVATALREQIAANQVERLVVAGNSAGGYAALVFGTLLGADAVLCFAPQTILDLDALADMGDHRWDERLHELLAEDALDPAWVDLGSALARERHTDTPYSVFFDDSLQVDRLHAERLIGLDGLRLYRFGRGAHHLVRALRDCGALERQLRQALSGVAPAAAGEQPGAAVGAPRSLS